MTRDAQANNLGLSFDFANPDFTVPALPDPEEVASKPCTLGGGDVVDSGAQAHASDLADLEAMAQAYGFPIGTGAPSDIFREPDSVQKALG